MNLLIEYSIDDDSTEKWNSLTDSRTIIVNLLLFNQKKITYLTHLNDVGKEYVQKELENYISS